LYSLLFIGDSNTVFKATYFINYWTWILFPTILSRSSVESWESNVNSRLVYFTKLVIRHMAWNKQCPYNLKILNKTIIMFKYLPLHKVFFFRPECSQHKILTDRIWMDAECMHAISIIRISASGRCCLGIRTGASCLPTPCLRSKAESSRTLKSVWTCCHDVWTDVTLNCSKLLNTNGCPDTWQRIQLFWVGVYTEFS
jgi:hypothetical protein